MRIVKHKIHLVHEFKRRLLQKKSSIFLKTAEDQLAERPLKKLC